MDAFAASYRGLGAHRRLLTDAVAEIRSFLARAGAIVHHMFPDLAGGGGDGDGGGDGGGDGAVPLLVDGQSAHSGGAGAPLSFQEEFLEPTLFSRTFVKRGRVFFVSPAQLDD